MREDDIVPNLNATNSDSPFKLRQRIYAAFFNNLTPLNLPEVEIFDLRSDQHQNISPLLWKGWGKSNDEDVGYDNIFI